MMKYSVKIPNMAWQMIGVQEMLDIVSIIIIIR